MKISLEWIGDFVSWIETDPQRIADRMTLGTAEVEEVEVQGTLLAHCCVGNILTVEKHPNADKLIVCTVETDKGKKTVVCGGTNVKEGMLVAFAHIGATVKWHGGELMQLESVKIRGVASEGMICAAEELGLTAMFPAKPEDGERPIIDLKAQSSKLKAGMDLRKLLSLHDTILHINNTAITMRPDLFSHIGFARECVALGLATWKKDPDWTLPAFPATKSAITVKVERPELMPRYLGCTLSIDSLGVTPDWMKKRIEAMGHRSVNLPVDITNYVAAEVGVPLHSFDADDIRGTVHMRLSKKHEKITTLDEVERNLPVGALILSDDEGAFDLLGIMGGLRSSTKESTKNIYLHAASLDPAAIRRGIVGVGLRTDAATVYEKGVPPIITEIGFMRALNLFLELVPGAKITSSLESVGDNGNAPTIPLTTEDVRKRIGKEIPEKTIVKILTNLGCDVKKEEKKEDPKLSILPARPAGGNSQFSISVPLHRLRDLRGEHDLIEEIGRIYGYDKIEGDMPAAVLRIPERDNRLHSMRDTLKAEKFFELVPLSFVSKHLMQRAKMSVDDAVEIENPLGEETAFLQTSTLPHLLSHAENNVPLTTGTLRTFHWGHVFHTGKPEFTELSLLVAAKSETDLLHDPFLALKEVVTNAACAAGYELESEGMKRVHPYAHPGRAATLTCGGKHVGEMFEVHPTVRGDFDLPARVAAATVDISTLFTLSPGPNTASSVPLYPAVTYDVTVAHTMKHRVADLLAKAKTKSVLLESISVHDLFQKKDAKDYHLTLRCVYRSPERTLTEEEAKKEHEKVMAAMRT